MGKDKKDKKQKKASRRKDVLTEITEKLAASPPALTSQPFRKELEKLLNRHSLEGPSNTPDFILAEFLHGCLAVFDSAINRRERWYGRPAGYDSLEKLLKEEF